MSQEDYPTLNRQLPLFETMKAEQAKCEHRLVILRPQVVTCVDCGALWFK